MGQEVSAVSGKVRALHTPKIKEELLLLSLQQGLPLEIARKPKIINIHTQNCKGSPVSILLELKKRNWYDTRIGSIHKFGNFSPL
jgi:hypothetical protein